MARVLPGKSNDKAFHNSIRKYKFRRPTSLYPHFEAKVVFWKETPVGGEFVLAAHSKAEGKMTPYEAQHYRECFRRIANRYGYYAGLHYNTSLVDYELRIVVLSHKAGFPKLSEAEAHQLRGGL